MSLSETAEKNLKSYFVDNPCRGIVLGADNNGNCIQLSWIMGRSSNSQNRVYVVYNDVLRTAPFDASKVEDPRLIIYNAMRSAGPNKNVHVVGNGDQTDTIAEKLAIATPGRVINCDIYEALNQRYCEPDAPIFTPRITGCQIACRSTPFISLIKADPGAKEHWVETVKSSGLKKDDFRKPGMSESQVTEAYNKEIGSRASLDHNKFPSVYKFFDFWGTPKFGYCLTTYKPGSKELASFDSEPFAVPIRDSLEETMRLLWDNLEPEWRVALGGKKISPDNECVFAVPINKHLGV